MTTHCLPPILFCGVRYHKLECAGVLYTTVCEGVAMDVDTGSREGGRACERGTKKKSTLPRVYIICMGFSLHLLYSKHIWVGGGQKCSTCMYFPDSYSETLRLCVYNSKAINLATVAPRLNITMCTIILMLILLVSQSYLKVVVLCCECVHKMCEVSSEISRRVLRCDKHDQHVFHAQLTPSHPT